MLVEVKAPVFAESIADARLLDWHKAVGETVAQGDVLIDLETDKVTLEVTAPDAGVIKEIKRQTGETIVSEELLAVIDTAAKPTASPPAASRSAAAETAERHPPPARLAATPKQSPSVRRLVAEHALNPEHVPAGAEGRLTKADVLGYLAKREQKDETQGAGAETKRPGLEPVPETPGERAEKRVPMTRLRLRAAERLLAAQHEHAILTTFNEVDMQAVMALRGRLREDFEQSHGVRLGYMSFFVKAVLSGLRKFPLINASVEGNDIVYHGYYDFGVAVSSPRGLVVPVVRDVDKLNFAEIEQRINDLGEKARNSSLTIEDLTGGTFTITNGGVFGSLLSTPIINPPQSAILGMHKIEERPVAVDGQVVVRPMMYVALSYDHRIIDGREAVQFLVTVKTQLEDPARMLMGL